MTTPHKPSTKLDAGQQDSAPRPPHLLNLPITALIFDMDGTMIHSMPYHAESWAVFMEKHEIKMSLDEFLRITTGRTGMECIRLVLDENLSDAECLHYLEEKEALYREIFAPPNFSEVPGFDQFYRRAHELGFLLAGGTAGDLANVEFALSHLHLGDLLPLKKIVRGDEGISGKPAPDIFLEAARRLKVAPQNCLVFEDAIHGIAAAGNAGMRAVAMCTTLSRSELAAPHVLTSAPNYRVLLQAQVLERWASEW